MKPAYSLHCSSFLGLPFRILNIELDKPKKGTTMETIGETEAKTQPIHEAQDHNLESSKHTGQFFNVQRKPTSLGCTGFPGYLAVKLP